MSDTKKKLLYVLFLFVFTTRLWAFTSLTHSCPDRFVGTVLSVSELQTPLLNRNKLEVVFQVDQVEKGDVDTVVTLQFIPLADTTLSEGLTYIVSTENGFLCSIKKQ